MPTRLNHLPFLVGAVSVLMLTVSACGNWVTSTPPPKIDLGSLIADINAHPSSYVSNQGGPPSLNRACGRVQKSPAKQTLYERVIASGSAGSNNDLSYTHSYNVYTYVAANGATISLLQDLTAPSSDWGTGASDAQAQGVRCYEVYVAAVHVPSYTPPNDPSSYLGGDDASDVVKNIGSSKWHLVLVIDKPITRACYNQDDQCG